MFIKLVSALRFKGKVAHEQEIFLRRFAVLFFSSFLMSQSDGAAEGLSGLR
jgi:hypothetical protein